MLEQASYRRRENECQRKVMHLLQYYNQVDLLTWRSSSLTAWWKMELRSWMWMYDQQWQGIQCCKDVPMERSEPCPRGMGGDAMSCSLSWRWPSPDKTSTSFCRSEVGLMGLLSIKEEQKSWRAGVRLDDKVHVGAISYCCPAVRGSWALFPGRMELYMKWTPAILVWLSWSRSRSPEF